ncbi:MAG: glycosyltransferase [Sideroxyarcus sp.]|nr:glycosyltransferase [Sideroxyarcus sp.]
MSDPEQMATPIVSVVMPVYNGERHLAEAIESILTQTFSNFELIIIDDGSTDGSLAILKEYEKRDARIRLIARENRNLATTLNDLIDLARGEWIARMDQDDIALPHRLERQLQWMQETKADISGSWIKTFGTSGSSVLKHPQTDAANKMELLFGSCFAHPTVMMKTALVKQLRYDKAWEKCEDYDLWERAARAGWKMTNVPQVLLLYRQHGAQISSASLSKQLQLSQEIRHRYWGYIFDSMRLEKTWIDEVLKLRDPSSPKSNLDYVDAAFTELMQNNEGEARKVVFEHATRLYLRAAGQCSDVFFRWSKLNRVYGSDQGLMVKFKLLLLSILRIRSDSPLFNYLKSVYFRLGR